MHCVRSGVKGNGILIGSRNGGSQSRLGMGERKEVSNQALQRVCFCEGKKNCNFITKEIKFLGKT